MDWQPSLLALQQLTRDAYLCCCTQPDFRQLLVLVQPDVLWLCQGSRTLGQRARRVYERKLPCACRFHPAKSSPDGRLALLQDEKRGSRELLLWDIAAGQLLAQHTLFLQRVQWLPATSNEHRLCCTERRYCRSANDVQVCVRDDALRTLASSQLYEQRLTNSAFEASPCGELLAATDNANGGRLTILSTRTCAAVAEADHEIWTGDAVRLLWASDSSAVLVLRARREAAWVESRSIFWLHSQSWQPVSHDRARVPHVHVCAWPPQGLLIELPATERTASPRLLPCRPSPDAALDVASSPLAALTLLTHGPMHFCFEAAFSSCYTWLAILTLDMCHSAALSVAVLRTRTQITVQQWCLQPDSPESKGNCFSLAWASSGCALICIVRDEYRKERSGAYVLEFDQQP